MNGALLKHVASVRVSNVDKKVQDGQPEVRLVNYTDVYYGDRLTPDLDLMWATATPAQVRQFRLLHEDVVITKDSEDPSDIGVAAFVEATAPDMVCGYHLAILRPTQRVLFPRFLSWVMQSSPVLDQLSSSATGVTRFGLRLDAIGSVRLPLPDLAIQRAIADYLDAETARIDALIAKKRRMIELLEERFEALRTALLFGDAELHRGRLAHAVQLLPGYAFRSDDFVPEAEGTVRLLRGVNIAPGSLRWTDSVFVPEHIAREVHGFALALGDIVIGMDRPLIGSGMRVAAVEASDLPCLLVQRVARIRPNTGTDAGYILHALQSAAFAHHFAPITTGVSVPHISPEQILSFRVPLPARHDQERAARLLDGEQRRSGSTVRALERQIALLIERRQTLITAATTGELRVPGVAA